MTIRYLDGTSIVTAVATDAIVAVTGDTIIIGVNGVYGSTTSDGIDTASSLETSINVSVAGLVFGNSSAIDLRSDAVGDNSITIEATGRAISDLNPAVYLGGTNVRLVNLGLIQSATDYAIQLEGTSSNYVLNTGTILPGTLERAIQTVSTAGAVTLVNLGTIGTGGTAVFLSSRDDVVWNAGTIVGDVELDEGNNLYQGPGRVTGRIIGDIGADTIIGGAFDDTIDGDMGSNWLAGGDGADLILIDEGWLGVSVVYGGTFGGIDTSTSDTIETADTNYGFNIFLTSNYVTSVANELVAVLAGIENATGGGINDGLFGSAGANVLDGGDGNDWIVGNGGADTFRFSLASDADGDNIRDFRRSEGDRIDLGRIDANTATATDDAFVFRTVHTNNAAGEAVVINYGSSAVVNLYINADNTIDGSFVVVYGEAGVTSLTALDFLL